MAIGVRLLRVASILTALAGTPTAGIAAPTPWMSDVAYDIDALDKFDIYRPAGVYDDLPFVMFIHGGGWWNGDKSYLSAEDIAFFTGRRIALVSINYRNIPAAQDAHLFPPLLGPLEDCKRALQFLRYHAEAFALDPKRVGLWGDSAGAFDALWLGLPVDRADSSSENPLLQMSTKVEAIGVSNAQTTIDPAQMRAWVGPHIQYGGHAFGLPEKDFDRFLARRETLAGWFPKLSPASLVQRGSPPLFLLYDNRVDDASTDPMYFVHSPHFGEHLAAIAHADGVPVTLRVGAGPADHAALLRFLADAVTRKPAAR